MNDINGNIDLLFVEIDGREGSGGKDKRVGNTLQNSLKSVTRIHAPQIHPDSLIVRINVKFKIVY